MISFAVFSYLTKNLFKFLIQSTHFYFSFCLINQILFPESSLDTKMLLSYFFVIFALYCLISVIKAQNENKKINLKLIEGLNRKNYKLTNLITVSLLFMCGIFPSLISTYAATALRNIYVFDKYTALLIFAFLFSNCLILFGILRIIFLCYGTKTSILDMNIKKGTTFNYVIPILILLSLFILNL